jgi:hypothetical protein
VEEKKICESRPAARIFASRGSQLLNFFGVRLETVPAVREENIYSSNS